MPRSCRCTTQGPRNERHRDSKYPEHLPETWTGAEDIDAYAFGKPWVCSPDIVTLVYQHDGRGPVNSDVKCRDLMVTIVSKGLEGFRSEKGLSLAGPRHYEFDVDYVPIEVLLSV